MNVEKGKNLHKFAIILFVITLIINYLASAEVIFPFSQQEVSDMYPNYLAPAGFTFSIWGVLYILMAVTLAIPWVKNLSDEFKNYYFQNVIPLYILWMILNILWLIAWSQNMILLSMLFIFAYAIVMIRLLDVMEKSNTKCENGYILLFPIGLHAGWIIFATFINIMTLMVANGFDGLSQTGVLFTIVFMALALISLLGLFKKYDNSMITVLGFWALFGIFMKQIPSSNFVHSNQAVMLAAITFFVLGLIAHFAILNWHKNNTRARSVCGI